MINLLIEIVLMLIMFSIGLTLTIDRFKAVFQYPKSIITGLFLQIIALPLLAFGFCVVSDIGPEWKVGVLILSLCPGGTTSNFISYLMKGNVELSVAMTTINSLLSVLSIPLLGNFALTYFLNQSATHELAFETTVFQLLLITLVPMIIGIVVKRKLPNFTAIIQENFTLKLYSKTFKIAYLKLITMMLLGTMFMVKLFASESAGGTNLTQHDVLNLLPTVLLFNAFGLTIGYFIPKMLRLKQNTSMTIGIEVGLQNTSLAFLVIGAFIQNTAMQQPALVYALFSFWTAILFALIVKRYGRLIDEKIE